MMRHSYRFAPVPRSLHWCERAPGNEVYTVHIHFNKFKGSIASFTTPALYVAQSYEDAQDYMEALATVTPDNRKRRLFVKQKYLAPVEAEDEQLMFEGVLDYDGGLG
jgi:hypothetical protein